MKRKLAKLLFISFIIFLICILSIQFLDKPITLFFYNLFYESEPILFTRFFDWIKDGFYFKVIFLKLCLLGILLCLPFKKWKLSLQLSFLFCTNIVVTILTFYLKTFFGRTRPYFLIEKGKDSFFNTLNCQEISHTSYAFHFFDGVACYESFPSGHTSSVFWLAFSFGLLVPKLRIPLFMYAFLIALARVFTTIHYFSDVVFGGFIAFFVVCVSYEFLLFLCRKLSI